MHAIEANGARIPALGLGTWRLSGRACREAVARALGLGYRHIDTARMYGNEAEVGAGLADAGVPREEVFLTTKVWPDQLEPGALRASAEASLADLAVDHVDLLLIHWPNPRVPVARSLAAMAELQAEGKVRHIGVSNFTAGEVREAAEAAGAPVVCDQVEYHPFRSQRELLAELRARAMALVAYCPLAQGQAAGDATLREIAAKHGRSAAQVALRWLVQQDGVAAVPKAGREAHMRANLEVFDFALDAEDLAAIEGLRKDLHLIGPA